MEFLIPTPAPELSDHILRRAFFVELTPIEHIASHVFECLTPTTHYAVANGNTLVPPNGVVCTVADLGADSIVSDSMFSPSQNVRYGVISNDSETT